MIYVGAGDENSVLACFEEALRASVAQLLRKSVASRQQLRGDCSSPRKSRARSVAVALMAAVSLAASSRRPRGPVEAVVELRNKALEQIPAQQRAPGILVRGILRTRPGRSGPFAF